MAMRLPASQRTREELTALIEGRLSTASARAVEWRGEPHPAAIGPRSGSGFAGGRTRSFVRGRCAARNYGKKRAEVGAAREATNAAIEATVLALDAVKRSAG
jgi:hypothetical protein